MTDPIVSVIIPVGPRHAEHARLAAASVQWQSLAPICETIIACDAGVEVPPLPNVTILPSDGIRHGPAYQRNRALEWARGQFILPLDADDYLLRHSVEHLLREYSRGTHGYIYGDAYTLERDGRYMLRGAPDYIQDHMRRYNIHVVTALTPAKHWRAVGGWDEGVDAWEDWSGHLRLAMAGVCGHRLPQPILTYRVYEGDRMTQFYGGATELMEKVLVRYRDDTGEIPMASCCGGDSGLAALAAQSVQGAPQVDAAPMEGGLVRVEYIGEDRGASTWEHPIGTRIRLGNNAIDRFKDVTPEQAAWLQSVGAPVRVVPTFDGPKPPEPLRPIVQAADVLTPDAATVKAIRPQGKPWGRSPGSRSEASA